MKAYVINHTGQPDVLSLQDFSDPVIQDGEVRIRVHAFGINRLENDIRAGHYGPIDKPTILGIEAVGEILEDSSGNFKVGQPVATAMGGLGAERTGSYAEQVVVHHENVIALDHVGLSWEELAALPEAYLTAWGALSHAMNLKVDQHLLIRGATSSVGQAAIVLARQMGANVIATTRRQSQTERLLALGANQVLVDQGNIASQIHDFWPQGADAVLEIVGASTIRDSLHAVRPFGEVVVIGLLGGRVIEQLDLLTDFTNAVGLRFFSTQMLGTPDLPLNNAPLAEIARLLASQKIPSTLGHVFNFNQLAQAHELMESNQAIGKIVVRITEEN